ncbi:hypothetical protein BKA57DRAFT_476425 [Linnemannia elongata]|nr:hypothetical protein BKA57DRAFT_476425 [Linnemannia elongata]
MCVYLSWLLLFPFLLPIKGARPSQCCSHAVHLHLTLLHSTFPSTPQPHRPTLLLPYPSHFPSPFILFSVMR